MMDKLALGLMSNPTEADKLLWLFSNPQTLTGLETRMEKHHILWHRLGCFLDGFAKEYTTSADHAHCDQLWDAYIEYMWPTERTAGNAVDTVLRKHNLAPSRKHRAIIFALALFNVLVSKNDWIVDFSARTMSRA